MFLADGSQDAHAEGVSYELCDVSRVGLLKQLAAMIFYGVGRYKRSAAISLLFKPFERRYKISFSRVVMLSFISVPMQMKNLEINKLSSTKVAKINKR